MITSASDRSNGYIPVRTRIFKYRNRLGRLARVKGQDAFGGIGIEIDSRIGGPMTEYSVP
ncbi:hypothetical protein [Paenibacillus mendelii]|uniref:Uncharacterized protein n=1 Tax=Paenibacillus mendelii TaxID=206163 RepID=A0ABV6JJ49_9BACL|nr:hypothetical protein [Paenibacillus mendelii]MCQ6558873.1 hypothetical protein [Paenibacillus mendelii]